MPDQEATTDADVANISKPLERVVPQDPGLPPPEDELEDYTVHRVQRGIDYAIRRRKCQKRAPSPMQISFLAVYQTTCEHLLSVLVSEPRDAKAFKQGARQIRTIEKKLNDYCWVRACGSGAEQQWQEQILGLRHLALYARHGDYTKMEVRDKRAFVELTRKELWSDISETIMEEAPAWERIKSDGKDIGVATTRAVWNTCLSVHVDFERTLEIIHFYGKRIQLEHGMVQTNPWSKNYFSYNKHFSYLDKMTAHSSLEDILKHKHYSHLSQMLFRDYADIHSVIPAHYTEEKAFMEAFLYEKMRRWYTWDFDEDFDIPQSWQFTDQLKKDAEEIAKDPKRAIDEIDAVIAEAAKRSVEELELHRQATLQVIKDSPGLPHHSRGSFKTLGGAYRLLKRRRIGVITNIERRWSTQHLQQAMTMPDSDYLKRFAISVAKITDTRCQLDQCILDCEEKK